MRALIVFVSFFFLHFDAKSQSFVFGDALPDAPLLAERGQYKVGVRTLNWINPSQTDVLNSKDGVDPLYDRKLTVEIWYPATLKDTEKEEVLYDEVLGISSDPKRPLIPFKFAGRASRDASIKIDSAKYPLVIVSHGYVGSRYLMTYLTENLASKGYVVVAIDHTESTFRDAAGFPSTLLNRSKDVLFAIKNITDLVKKNDKFFAPITDIENIGLIGYSMGGYGVLNVAGAAYSEKSVMGFKAFTKGSNSITERTLLNPDYIKTIDPRIKAVVAFAPWGMEREVWDEASLQPLKIPTLFICGDKDDISGYEKGVKSLFEKYVNADRYLLTYLNARHNVAPNSPPNESLQKGLHFDEYYRYAEPSWNERRLNNINQHFVTAFLGIHLKKQDNIKYLSGQTSSNVKTWPGFKERTCTGMELVHIKP